MACHATQTNQCPSTFMRLMNHIMRSLIGWCVLVYFNDILVYSMCVDDHVKKFFKQEELEASLLMGKYSPSLSMMGPLNVLFGCTFRHILTLLLVRAWPKA
ncbi:hypothetical protein CR513_07402, partial [Mucuna pruriens]